MKTSRRRIVFFEITPPEREFLKASPLRRQDLVLLNEEAAKANPSLIGNPEIVSGFIYSKFDAGTLRRWKKLKLIATRSTGFDHIDLKFCKRNGILVSNVPHYGENTVAEHTFALILALSRKVHQAYVRTIRTDFSLEGLQGFDLKDKTLGVIGTGRIGLHVIRIAKGFGMRIVSYDVAKNMLLAETLGFEYLPLEKVLAQSDIVTLHAPYLSSTHHLINKENIRLIKKGALLINTARGALVDTEALVRALDEGILGGAGLDVLEGEEVIKEERQVLTPNYPEAHLKTLVQNHILLHRENVVITPHIAFNSREAFLRILQTTCANIETYLKGQTQNLVSIP